MADICCDVVGESEASSQCETSSSVARQRRMEIRRFRFVAGVPTPEFENDFKRQKLEQGTALSSRKCVKAVENCDSEDERSFSETESGKLMAKEIAVSEKPSLLFTPVLNPSSVAEPEVRPIYGVASVCGRRRDMEDAVSIHPSLCKIESELSGLHYFGVYDGHGCSHVAMKCRDRMHELVKEELENREDSSEWRGAMERSFFRMDKEVIDWNKGAVAANCRCELQTPECNAVGSTAVVAILTPDKIIVANCGDSRAVLCRNGKAIPLSSDHKPDRPDELNRIQSAGGRVIYWDGARVLGVLAMSRAIGDNYLKPYVSCEPEVTVTDRTSEDDCLILASDGLWDVISNETACGVARMCLRAAPLPAADGSYSPEMEVGGEDSDKACSDASMLLTKLALARRSSDNVSVVVVDLKKEMQRYSYKL